MVRIFDKSKLKTDCENCDAVCCVATKFKLPDYYKPPRTPCKHLDQEHGSCTIFDKLEDEGFTFCRDFDCYGGGLAVSNLFKEIGKNWASDPEIAEVQFHTFSIVYFQLVKYLHPDRAIEIDVPDDIIEELKPFTEQALDMLAETADPFEG
ncbi:MAG: hypothetical protein HN731_04760 [Rhodospirillaceae bacterium]|jgi:hypothetical protein|nr:hypothetical protein [Rhodospirillaceae bacterium]MBT7954474.1 hypothetical protein [Rhodospirillaceae bacterium]